MTQPPCWYSELRAAMRPALSQAGEGDVEVEGADWNMGALMVV
jgi:hypothetical protein